MKRDCNTCVYKEGSCYPSTMIFDKDKTCYDELEWLLKKAFNAGRPKWHKVADGDLPSEEGGWVCNQNGLPCFFDWGTEQWLDCEGTQIRTTEWCHMPHKE